MIFDGVVTALTFLLRGLLGGLAALVPVPPAWVDDPIDGMGTILSYVYTLDSWLPVSFAFGVVGTVFAFWITSAVIGLVRVVASYFTLGGGAT